MYVQVAQAELHPDKYIANLKEFYTYAEVSPQDCFPITLLFTKW